MKRLILLTTVLLTTVSVGSAPAQAAPGAHRDPHGNQAAVNVFRAWTSTEYEVGGATFTDQGAPNCQSFGLPAGTEMHSAALLENTFTVVLYSTTNCTEGSEVATLNAANKCDSGFVSKKLGVLSPLGDVGALSYRVTPDP